jgi:hypothetical protein
MDTTPAPTSPATLSDPHWIPPRQVWTLLTESQQHCVFQTIVRICQEVLAAPAHRPGREMLDE